VVAKIEEGMPVSAVGKRVALLDRITRADAAALLIHELRIDDVYRRSRPEEAVRKKRPHSRPPDILAHAERAEIERVLRLDIPGLEVFGDGRFGPDDFVTRASLAMVIADIIATVEGDPSLPVKYVGTPSPFRDVRCDAPYFNAVMVCRDKGDIMGAEGNRVFMPVSTVSGADALLMMRRLKEALRIP
jgi:hypothetical protein